MGGCISSPKPPRKGKKHRKKKKKSGDPRVTCSGERHGGMRKPPQGFLDELADMRDPPGQYTSNKRRDHDGRGGGGASSQHKSVKSTSKK